MSFSLLKQRQHCPCCGGATRFLIFSWFPRGGGDLAVPPAFDMTIQCPKCSWGLCAPCSSEGVLSSHE